MISLVQDLRYAFRLLVKQPGFTAVAVLTLALGIGANTAVFTLVNAVLLRMLPVSKPQELVELNATQKTGRAIISFPMYRDIRARQLVLTDIFATAGETPVRLTIPHGGESVELDNIRTDFVTANYFRVLGVQPVLGRFFAEEEDRNPGTSESVGSVAVISYGFWERQFGRDPAVLDRTVLVGRSPCRVLGVMAQGFSGEGLGTNTDVWVPLTPFTSADNLENRRGVITFYVGRLRPGVDRAQAQGALTVLFQQLIQSEPVQSPRDEERRATAPDFSLVLSSAATGLDYGVRRTFTKPLWIIMAIV